jgi:hypothetical protein
LAFCNVARRVRQVAPGAVDVEIEHRHCRLVRRAFAPTAAHGRLFQRLGDGRGRIGLEDVGFEVHRIAGFGHVL